MNKMALIILLGLNLVVAQAFAQAYEDEVVYEDGVEYVDEGVDEGIDEVDEVEDIADNGAYDDGAYEPQPNTAMRSNESVDATDITRWVDSEEDIARRKARAKREAQQEAEYKQNLTRQRSGGFIGLGTGYSALAVLKIPGASEYLSLKGAGLGLLIGYQHALNMYSGFRIYVEGDVNFNKGVFWGKAQNTPYSTDLAIKALGNVDFYLEGNMGRNYTETLGVFVGLGAGYIYEPSYKNNMAALTVNGGFHSIILTHNRIELFARIYPLYNLAQNMDIWLRYSYMF